jgi:hypothetical protein
MSNTSKHEAKKLVAVALGRLIGREYRSDGWLERLVREFEEELRKINSECRVALYGSSFSADRVYFAEILVRCNEREPVLARIYVEHVTYLKVANMRVE